MGVLANQRHELFARALAEGKTHIEAHKEAGFAPNRGNASTLANREDILDRVKQIKTAAVRRTEVSLESLIREAAEIQARANADGQFSAAVAALTAKAKLAGLWIERGEHANTNVNYAVSDHPPTDEEWIAEHVTEH